MKLIRTVLLTLLLAGCAHSGPVADGVTTFAGLAAGAQEINPIIAVNPIVMAPLSIAARTGAVRYARGTDGCSEVVGAVDSLGWGAAANNIAVLAGAGPAAIPIGVIAMLLTYEKRQDQYANYCRMTCSLSDLPDFATRASCDRGRIVVLANDWLPSSQSSSDQP